VSPETRLSWNPHFFAESPEADEETRELRLFERATSRFRFSRSQNVPDGLT
jgi:hypothetical protein